LQTLSDAIVIFEVLSDDTAGTDRVEKIRDYAHVPSLKYYVMLEQDNRTATICNLVSGGAWTTARQTEGVIALPDLDIVLPFDEIYRGLSFPA
jgi:Uma2 family endonuclease